MKANYSNNRHSLKRKPSSLTRFRVKKVILFQKLFIILMMEMFLYAHFRTLCERKKRILMKELYTHITIQLLTQMLLKQGYVALRLKSSLQKFDCRHHHLVDRYGIFISQMTMDLLLFK